MTKDEFFEKHQLEGSLAILDLDENDDQSKACYNWLLDYRNMPLDEFLANFDEIYTEQEFLEMLEDELNWIIQRAKNVKRFIKKRQKQLRRKLCNR